MCINFCMNSGGGSAFTLDWNQTLTYPAESQTFGFGGKPYIPNESLAWHYSYSKYLMTEQHYEHSKSLRLGYINKKRRGRHHTLFG